MENNNLSSIIPETETNIFVLPPQSNNDNTNNSDFNYQDIFTNIDIFYQSYLTFSKVDENSTTIVSVIKNNEIIEHYVFLNNQNICDKFITTKPNIKSKLKLENEKICSICSENLIKDNNNDDDNKIFFDLCQINCCSNHYHIACLDKWIFNCYKQNKYPTCPLCRNTINCDIHLSYYEETKNIENINLINTFNNNYRYEFNSETNKYLIYNLRTNNIKMTLSKYDVDFVMTHANCDMELSISSLVNQSGDIVNAIMYLEM